MNASSARGTTWTLMDGVEGNIQEVQMQEVLPVALLRLKTKHGCLLYEKTAAVTYYSPLMDACIAYYAYFSCFEWSLWFPDVCMSAMCNTTLPLFEAQDLKCGYIKNSAMLLQFLPLRVINWFIWCSSLLMVCMIFYLNDLLFNHIFPLFFY